MNERLPDKYFLVPLHNFVLKINSKIINFTDKIPNIPNGHIKVTVNNIKEVITTLSIKKAMQNTYFSLKIPYKENLIIECDDVMDKYYEEKVRWQVEKTISFLRIILDADVYFKYIFPYGFHEDIKIIKQLSHYDLYCGSGKNYFYNEEHEKLTGKFYYQFLEQFHYIESGLMFFNKSYIEPDFYFGYFYMIMALECLFVSASEINDEVTNKFRTRISRFLKNYCYDQRSLEEIQSDYNKYYDVGSSIRHSGKATSEILKFTTREIILELRDTFRNAVLVLLRKNCLKPVKRFPFFDKED